MKIMDMLGKAVKNGEISYYYRRTIIDMTRKVLENIAKNFANVREEVIRIVGGNILEHE